MSIYSKLIDTVKALTGIAFVLGLPAKTLAIDNPYIPRYPFSNAVLHYSVSGEDFSGTVTLYIDGSKKALYEESVQGTGKYRVLIKRLTLTTPEYIYRIDLIKKTGIRIENPIKYLIRAFNKLSEKEKVIVKKNTEALGTNIVGNVKGKRIPGAERIMRINADLIEINGVKTLVWPRINIPLKWSTGGKEVTVTKIENNVLIAPEIFEVPEGIRITFASEESQREINKAITQFHFMRAPDAISLTREITKREESKAQRREAGEDIEVYTPRQNPMEEMENRELEFYGDLD